MRSCIKMVKLQCLREWGLRGDGGVGDQDQWAMRVTPGPFLELRELGREGGVARSYYIMKHKIVDI